MSLVVLSFILWVSPEKNGPVGLGLEINNALIISTFIVFALVWWAFRLGKKR